MPGRHAVVPRVWLGSFPPLRHRDATVDRAHERAQVTTDALGLVDPRNPVRLIERSAFGIPRGDLQGISPVAITTGEQIKLGRAVTIEDFSVKLPQLAGGVNSTSTGSDGYGAQTLDLRNLGQNRTLVLINGTRATPFSFRNAVDVNAIPAPLLKRVDEQERAGSLIPDP